MKAFAAKGNKISTLSAIETERPHLNAHDLLINVDAVSVNPVDTKVRQSLSELTEPVILGYDGHGTVVERGSKAHLFAIGDKVFWAGDVTRSGSNAEFQAVDERIVGFAPKKISKAKAVAMPLTSLTAYELLFEKLAIDPTGADKNKTLLIINGAGGVGSVATQLAKKIAKLHVIASASTPEAIAWVKKMGADEVVNHHGSLVDDVRHLGHHHVDYILILNAVNQHITAVTELIAPQGKIANIIEPAQALNLDPLAHKSASFSFEWMFTKAVSQTPDIESQHHILNQIAQWLDSGKITSTMTQNLGTLTEKNLQNAHEMLENGHTIGKIVLITDEK